MRSDLPGNCGPQKMFQEGSSFDALDDLHQFPLDQLKCSEAVVFPADFIEYFPVFVSFPVVIGHQALHKNIFNADTTYTFIYEVFIFYHVFPNSWCNFDFKISRKLVRKPYAR
jgi:hypothetical protein